MIKHLCERVLYLNKKTQQKLITLFYVLYVYVLMCCLSGIIKACTTACMIKTSGLTECDGSCKQLADVVQQSAVRDESSPWSQHLNCHARTCLHPRQDNLLPSGMVWSLLGIRPCKTWLISEPLQAPRFLWQYCTHDIRHFSDADDSLFKAVLKNSHHVPYPYFPEDRHQQRPYSKALIAKTIYLGDRDYIMRTRTRTVISL